VLPLRIARLPSGKTATVCFTDDGMAEAFSEEQGHGTLVPCSELLRVVRDREVDGLAVNPGTPDAIWLDRFNVTLWSLAPFEEMGPLAELDADDLLQSLGITTPARRRAVYRLVVENESAPAVVRDLLAGCGRTG
jgi:hypothetical protein